MSKKTKTALYLVLAIVIAVGFFLSVRARQKADYRLQVTSQIEVALPKAWVDANDGNLLPILSSVRMVPFLEGEAIRGFKVLSIDPGSPVEDLKLKNEDILLQVEDIVLNEPAKGLEVFKKIREKSAIFLVVEREGKLVGLSYKVVQP